VDPHHEDFIPTTIDGVGANRTKVDQYSEEHLRSDDGATLQVFEIEFDDQGRLWNRNRAEVSIERIKAVATAADGPGARVFVFSHGWDNNAEACNNTLACFREFLDVVRADEHQYQLTVGGRERAVIGVFLGWRGRSLAKPAHYIVKGRPLHMYQSSRRVSRRPHSRAATVLRLAEVSEQRVAKRPAGSLPPVPVL
jgi:hypothetical protein